MTTPPTYDQLAQRIEELERELASRDLEERQSIKHHLLGPIKDAMMTGLAVIDRQTHFILDINKAAARMIGLEKKEIIGHECHRFICPKARGECPITDGNQRIDHSERILLRADGTTLPILKTVTSLDADGREVLIETFVDISEQKKTESRLQAQGEFLKSVLDALTFPFYVINTDDYHIEMANAASNFGLITAGATCYQLTHHRDTPCGSDDHPCPITEVIKTRSPVTMEHVHKDVHGNDRIVEVHGFPIFDRNGRVTRIIEYSLDITGRHQAEADLQKAKEEAEAANRAKGQFMANMSHEIRTPMNGVIGLLDLLARTTLTDQQGRYLALASTSARRMMGIINDILDFSKIEAGKLTVEMTPFNLQDLLDETLRFLTVSAQQKGVELFFQVQRGVPVEVIGDPGRLRQVLMNLIANAIKFTNQGEVLLEVATRGETDADQVVLLFAVHDTGIGIPKEMQGDVFHPFTQADGSTTRNYGGTGLGLAIAAEIVGLMGGEIKVDSEPGQGSTFHFTVVLKRQQGAMRQEEHVHLEDFRRLAILLAMSDPAGQRMIANTLGDWLQTVETADSGPALLRALAQREYDVVFIDSRMTDLDYDALGNILAGGSAPPPLVLLKQSDTAVEAAAAIKPLIAATLDLPTSTSDLLRVIRTAIRHVSVAMVPPAPLPPAAGEENKKRPRVLVAEDDFINRTLMVTILEQEQWRTTAVENGRLALEALAAGEYDLVLMDLQMPEMDGLTATARIREQEKGSGKHIPIVALTAHAMKEDRDRCLAAGMDDYISKPVEYDRLFEVLNKLTTSE